MKFMFVIPPKAKKNVFHIVPPLGIGYLSAALKKQNIEVELVNCVKDGLNHAQFIDRLMEKKPDIVGYQVFSSDIKSVNEAIKMVKSVKPGIIQVVGGYHPSSVPYMSMQINFPDADFGFTGEAEMSLPYFVKKIEKGDADFKDVAGLLWRQEGKLIINKPCFYDDLDEIGMPDWELINPLEYQNTLFTIMVKAMPAAPILTTRGCPYRCTFCSAYKVNGRKVRVRKAENVLAEMDYLHSKFGIKEYQIMDDNFTWDRDFVMKLCNLLISGRRKYYWIFPNGIRLNTIDEELLLKMKEAGCYLVNIGIESGSDRVLKLIKKNFRVSDVKEKIQLIRRVGLPITASFIIGFPGETLEDIKKTEDLILSEDLFAAHIFMFHPLPGTEIFDKLVESGELGDSYLGYEADHSSFANCVYSPEGITKEELKKIHRRINRKFYLRPKRLVAILREIKSVKSLFYFTKRAFCYLS